MLQLRQIFPSADKVKQLEFHPVQPWLAVLNKSDCVTIWDYNAKQVVQEIPFSSSEDEVAQDVMLASLAERNAGLKSPPSLQSSTPGRGNTGKVRQIKFLDADVAAYQLTNQHRLVNGADIPAPTSPCISTMQGSRWLVAACENKVLMVDLATRKFQEVAKTFFDKGSPTCLAFVFPQPHHSIVIPSASVRQPILAIGCSDGAVRLVSMGSTSRLLAKLAPGSKNGITVVTTIPVKTATPRGQGDMILAGDKEGALICWDPFSRTLGVVDREVSPKMVVAGHEKEVLSLVLAAQAEDPECATPRLFTAGADNRVAAWDVVNLKEQGRVKMDSKTPLAGIGYCARNFTAIGANNLLIATATAGLIAMHTGTLSMRPVANLVGNIPSGTKKSPKVYCMACHPTNPSFSAVGANCAVAMCMFDSWTPLPVAPFPLASQALAHISPIQINVEPEPASYVTTTGTDIWHVTMQAQLTDSEEVRSASCKVAKIKVGSSGQSGKALLQASYDGSYVSVVYPNSRQFYIYYRSATEWMEVDRGAAASVSWHSHTNKYALLVEPPPVALPDLSKKVKKSKKGPDPEAVKAAMEAAQKAAAANTVIKIKEVQGTKVTELKSELNIGSTELPMVLHGGALIGVAMRRPAEGSPESTNGELLRAMCLFSWTTFTKVGLEIPEPIWMSWDPTLTYCAAAYSTHILLFSVHPSFHCVASLPIAGAQSAMWSIRQLYICTSSNVLAVFISGPPPQPAAGTSLLVTDAAPAVAGNVAYQIVVLACMGVTPELDDSLARKITKQDAMLPAVLIRPAGPLSILGPRGGILYLVDALCQPFVIPLTQPGLRARCLAAAGDVEGARMAVEAALISSHHDQVAHLLNQAVGFSGAISALNLSGLTLEAEAVICTKSHKWTQAVNACRALMNGCAAPTSTKARNILRTATGLFSTSQDAKEPTGEAVFVSPPVFKLPDPPPKDSFLDWDAPLKRKVDESEKWVRSIDSPAPLHGEPIHSEDHASSLLLHVAEMANSIGAKAVTRSALAALLLLSDHAPASTVSCASLRLAELGLAKELDEINQSDPTLPEKMGPQGLYLASAAGNPQSVQQSLVCGGQLALAALQSSSWRLPLAAVREQQWSKQLREAGFAPGGASFTANVSG